MAKIKVDEKAAVLKVIKEETEAFWNKDYKAVSRLWVHAGYVQHDDRTPAGIKVVKGWGPIGKAIKQYFGENPQPNPAAGKAARKRFSVRVVKDMAWVTYEQHEFDSGEQGMNKPTISRETKILEKHDGKWKLVYVGVLPMTAT